MRTFLQYFLGGLLCVAGCCLLLPPVFASEEETTMQNLVQGRNAFALELYGRLSERHGNLFFSPYSISEALAMTYAGARGETAAQMARVLHLPLDQEALTIALAQQNQSFQHIQTAGDVALTLANALWIQQDFPLCEEFLQQMTREHAAQLFRVNFKNTPEDARIRINEWVETATRKKIQNLIAPGVLHELTRLVLTNAIYFKGTWDHEFEKESTQDAPFWLTPESKTTVSMMQQQQNFKYGENETVQVLQLPYKGEDLAMIVLLPKAKDGLQALEAVLNRDNLDSWLSQSFLREVNVFLPKWKMTSQFNLSAILQEMGMTDAFSARADFSGMDPSKQLSVSEVVHKAFIDVNEEGTEAAAATAVIVGVTSVRQPQPIPVFKADHPFIFLIREQKTGSILFAGRVMNPAE